MGELFNGANRDEGDYMLRTLLKLFDVYCVGDLLRRRSV